MKKLLFVIISIMISTTIFAQGEETEAKPTTKLQEFNSKRGTLIIKDFFKVGELDVKYGKTTVEVVNIYEPTKEKEGRKGLKIEISTSSKEKAAFLDVDEVESLLKACDYFVETSKQWATIKKEYSEFIFRTKDNFEIGFYNDEDSLTLFLSTGSVYKVQTAAAFENLAQIRSVFQKGLDKINSLSTL